MYIFYYLKGWLLSFNDNKAFSDIGGVFGRKHTYAWVDIWLSPMRTYKRYLKSSQKSGHTKS